MSSWWWANGAASVRWCYCKKRERLEMEQPGNVLYTLSVINEWPDTTDTFQQLKRARLVTYGLVLVRKNTESPVTASAISISSPSAIYFSVPIKNTYTVSEGPAEDLFMEGYNNILITTLLSKKNALSRNHCCCVTDAPLYGKGYTAKNPKLVKCSRQLYDWCSPTQILYVYSSHDINPMCLIWIQNMKMCSSCSCT